MNRFILFILFTSSFIIGYSQRTAKVSATYTYYAPETMSVEEAKRIALDRAKIQAIADEFGAIVSQSTSTVVTNKNGESDTQFFALGGSDVKGEWIETIGEPIYSVEFLEHLLIVKVEVKGSIRELVGTRTEFEAIPLRNGTDLKYQATDFRNNDDMYLYFKSPADGYLTVFLIDERAKLVYNIFPYPKANYATYKICANEPYIFFSKKMAPELERANVVEYTLTCEHGKEINEMVIVFSPNNFQLPKIGEKSIGRNPALLEYESFFKWRANVIKHYSNLSVKSITITIQK